MSWSRVEGDGEVCFRWYTAPHCFETGLEVLEPKPRPMKGIVQLTDEAQHSFQRANPTVVAFRNFPFWGEARHSAWAGLTVLVELERRERGARAYIVSMMA